VCAVRGGVVFSVFVAQIVLAASRLSYARHNHYTVVIYHGAKTGF
jgi:hypothetical protein